MFESAARGSFFERPSEFVHWSDDKRFFTHMGVLGAFTVKLFDLFSALLSDRNSKNDNKAPSKRRLTLESLENRELLSAAPLEIYGPPTYETWASARSETASNAVVVSIRDVKYETAPLDLSNLSETADSPLIMEPVSETVYEDAASLLKGCVQETGEAATFNGARESQIKEITFDSQNVSNHTADFYSSDGLTPLLTMNGSGGSGGSGSGGGDVGSGGGTETPGGTVNLGLNVTEPDTNSLYSYGDGYALRENRGADDVCFEPNATFDYIEFTVASLPMGYEASLHFSGSASWGNDYHIYARGPYDVTYYDVVLTNGFLTLYGSSGGATTHYYITPCNNVGVQAVDKELTVSLENVHKSSSGGTSYEFNMGTTSFSVTLVDDDKWNVDVDASDPVASERLPGVAPDYGYYTFTRTAGVEGVPCDASYGLTVYFDVLVAPSDPYYCAARSVDYLLNANQLNENDSNVYLSNFQYRGWYDTEMTDEGTTEYRFHYQGTIPAYENSALLRLVPIFDWEDEGDVYELVGDPGEQTGEKVKITVTSTSLPVGSSGWDPIASATPADVEIKDGFVFATYFDGNGDGELDPSISDSDRRYVPYNDDDDNENNIPDYLDGSGGSSEDDLRKLRVVTWVGDSVTCEDGSTYSFDIYVNFPNNSNVSTWLEDDRSLAYTSSLTIPFYSLASGGSQNDILYTEGCSGGSVYPQFQLRTTLTTSGVPSEVPSLTLTRSPEFYVTAYSIDLDIDSDNDAGPFGAPSSVGDLSDWEDKMEDSRYGLGKVIVPNDGDRDHDEIFDCWDGYDSSLHSQSANDASEDFVPLQVTIPNDVSLSNLYVSFNYNFFTSFNPSDGGISKPTGQPGSIRIWKKNGGQARIASDDFITSGYAYSASELGFNNSRTITLYVEGIQENNNVTHAAQVLNSPKQDSWITVNLLVENVTGVKETVATDKVRYVVAARDTFYYCMAQADNQDLRCAVASKLIYEEKHMYVDMFVNIDKQLEKFGMSLFPDDIPSQDQNEFILVDDAILAQESLTPLGPSFAADVFYDYVSKKPLIVFAGTDITSRKDLKTDIMNAVDGLTEYYSAAFAIGRNLRENNNISAGKFVITGHSLGGGLATACALSAYSSSKPVKAITFNAATVSDGTCNCYNQITLSNYVTVNKQNVGSFVDAYIVRGEIVDEFQQSLVDERALGTIYEIGPHKSGFIYMFRAHLINKVLLELEHSYSIYD